MSADNCDALFSSSNRSLIDAYQECLLGGPVTMSAREMAQRAGTSVDSVAEYWSAMGFQRPDPDAPTFTQRDFEVYSEWNSLVASGAIDVATSRSLLRANSHLADRLSLWQFEALVEDAVRRLDMDDTAARIYVLQHMRERITAFEQMFAHSWRRQMDSLLNRLDKEVAHRGGAASKDRFPLNRSLGFVDMVSYTSSSSLLGGALVDLIERFEDSCRQVITEAGGRVVKTIGDAVLYIADDLLTGLEVVTSLVEHLNADDQILPVRASFVRGDVFSRSGDVFGPTVNLASRLADIAPVGKILTDPATAAAIAALHDDEGYRLEEFPTAELRGFGPISPYLLSTRD